MTARTARGWLLLPRLGVGQPVGIRPRRAGVRREMSALLRSLLAVAVISTVVGVAQPFGIGYRPNQAGNSLSPGKAPLRQALLSSFNEPAGGSPGDYAFVASDDGDITLLDAATGVVVATAQMNLCPPGQNGNDNCLPWYSCYQGVNDTYIQNLNLSPNGRDLYIYVGSLEGIFDCDNSPGGEFVLNTASGSLSAVDNLPVIPDSDNGTYCQYATMFTSSGATAYMVPPASANCTPSDELYTVSAAAPSTATGPVTLSPTGGDGSIAQLAMAPDGVNIAALETGSGDTYLGIFNPATGQQISATSLGAITPAPNLQYGSNFAFVSGLDELVVLTSAGNVDTFAWPSGILLSSETPSVSGDLSASQTGLIGSVAYGTSAAWFQQPGGSQVSATLTKSTVQGFSVSEDDQTAVTAFDSGPYADTISLAGGSPTVTQVQVGGVGIPFNNDNEIGSAHATGVAFDESDIAPIGGILTDAEMAGGSNEIEPYGCNCQGQKGGPVNTEDGDFYESYTDANVPTVGPALNFVRTYDENTAKTEIDQSASPGPFGYGWTDNWATSLEVSQSSGDITVVNPSGALTLFVPQSACSFPYQTPALGGTYCALPRVVASLTQTQNPGGYQLTLQDGTVDSFNSVGQLTGVADPEGRSLTVAYGAESPGQGECPGNAQVTPTVSCEVVTSTSGRTLTIGWSQSGESGEVTSLTDSAGNRTLYGYCSSSSSGYGTTCLANDLISVTNPSGGVTSYTYDSADSTSDLRQDIQTVQPPITSGSLPAGQPATFCSNSSQATAPVGFEANCYDSQGRVVAQSDASGRTLIFNYAAMNESTGWGTVAVTDGNGNVTDYGYAASGLVQKVTGANSASPLKVQYSYDMRTFAELSSLDGDGNLNIDVRDANGNVLSATDGSGNTSQKLYNPNNQVWCSVDAADYANGTRCPPGPPPTTIPVPPDYGMTINVYNSADELIATIDPLGNTSTYFYTTTGYGVPIGLVYCSVSPVEYGLVTCPSSYTTSSTAKATSTTYDSAGDVTSTTDPDGHTTSYSYSDSSNPGLVSSETSPDGTLTSFSYDLGGLVDRPDGFVLQLFGHDAVHL